MPLSAYLKLFCKSDILVDIKKVWRHMPYLDVRKNYQNVEMLKKTLFTLATLLVVNLGLIAQQKITEFKVGGLLSKDFSSDSE